MQDSFWSDVTLAWSSAHWHIPSNPSQIAAQVLWYNSHIKIQEKPIYYQKAHQAGVLCVLNIWHLPQKRFLTFQEFSTVYGDCISYLEFYGILGAIPKSWVKDLREASFIIEDFEFPYENLKSKILQDIYQKLTFSKKQLTGLADKWKEKLWNDITYEELLESFENLYKFVSDIKMRNFQFRFLHRIIYCAKMLYQWKITDSALCQLCQNDYETIEHLFYDCNVTQRFWEAFIAWFEARTDKEIIITKTEVMLCNHEISTVNTLLIMAKQHIFSRKIAERQPNIYIFREKVMNTIDMERAEAIKQKRTKPFIKKWRILFD